MKTCLLKQKGILFCMIFTCLCLTGCKEVPESVTKYTITSTTEDSPVAVSSSTDDLELFSTDLCVIPKSTKFVSHKEMATSVSSLLIDDTDNMVLYGDKIYKKMYPASITKIVTALVTIKYGNLEDTVTFSYDASHITEWGATLCGFKEGDQVNLHELLTCFLMYSGNDAGIAIAEHVGGSVEGFAEMMNAEMQALGASRSHFVNPHGLHDEDHYTCAYDLYLVFHELTNYDIFLDIIQKKSCKVKYKDAAGEKQELKFEATNRYINGKKEAPKGVTVIGGKTGTTSKAGSCLILYSQKDKANKYISIVLHADSADACFEEMNHLLQIEADAKSTK